MDDTLNHFLDPYTPVTSKIFFNWNIYATSEGGQLSRLAFYQKDGTQQYLSDRVMPGDTLDSAIKSGLEKDFGISEWKFIKATEFSDDAHDNQGQPVQRVNVYVEIPYFKVTNHEVLGMHLQWFVADLEDEDKADEAMQSLDSGFIDELRSGEEKDIAELWKAFTDWLHVAVPAQYAKLNPPATFKDFEDFALQTGYELPQNMVQLYKINNGGLCDAPDMNGILSLEFLPIKTVISEWKSWRDVEQGMYLDGDEPTYPNGAIKNTYANPKWIPLARDGGGNNIGIDLDPGETGTIGQIINFGRDEENKFVIAGSLEEFFRFILLQIADGNVSISRDTEAYWCIGDKDSHLTDELRKIIVPQDFVPTLKPKEQSQESESLGFFYYDKYEDGHISQSFTVSVERKGNEIAVQTGSAELKKVFKETIAQIDPNSDASAYRNELLRHLPGHTDGLSLRK